MDVHNFSLLGSYFTTTGRYNSRPASIPLSQRYPSSRPIRRIRFGFGVAVEITMDRQRTFEQQFVLKYSS
jgi:hypothetical protein